MPAMRFEAGSLYSSRYHGWIVWRWIDVMPAELFTTLHPGQHLGANTMDSGAVAGYPVMQAVAVVPDYFASEEERQQYACGAAAAQQGAGSDAHAHIGPSRHASPGTYVVSGEPVASGVGAIKGTDSVGSNTMKDDGAVSSQHNVVAEVEMTEHAPAQSGRGSPAQQPSAAQGANDTERLRSATAGSQAGS